MVQKKLSGLSKASQKKKQEALEKTEKAIAILAKNRQKITIRSVAREAGVSVSYIYKYPELAYKIQRLREQQKYSLVVSDRNKVNKDKQGETQAQQQEQLRLENEELKAIIERVKTGKNSIKELKVENIQLTQENIRLKKELEYTQQNLQVARKFILEQGRLDPEELEPKIKTIEVLQETKE